MAGEKGIEFAVIAGNKEFATNAVTVRSLAARSQVTIPISDLVNHVLGS